MEESWEQDTEGATRSLELGRMEGNTSVDLLQRLHQLLILLVILLPEPGLGSYRLSNHHPRLWHIPPFAAPATLWQATRHPRLTHFLPRVLINVWYVLYMLTNYCHLQIVCFSGCVLPSDCVQRKGWIGCLSCLFNPEILVSIELRLSISSLPLNQKLENDVSVSLISLGERPRSSSRRDPPHRGAPPGCG